MEVTGVVLGGIPIILWALENYRVALNPAKDYWRYESTLNTIRMNMFVQQEQLNVTLHNIGLQGASMTEVNSHLRTRFPEKCDVFMDILGHMDKIVQRLMDKLDIDLKGKPKWEEIAPGRVEWEWRRIKRSFNKKERQSLIDELQYWNNTLRNCFEKQEIPSDEGDRTIQELQARYDPKKCDDIRENARAIHKAIQSGWGCTCPQSHGGSIYLEWHNDKVLDPAVFKLALSCKKTQNGLLNLADECWQKILIKIEKSTAQSPSLAQAPVTPPVAPIGEPASRCPSSSRRVKWRQFLGLGHTKTKSDVESVESNYSISSSQTAFASTITLTLPDPSTVFPISGLCQLLQNCTATAEYLGYLPDLNSSSSRHIEIHSTAAKPSFPKMIPVNSLLSPSNQQILFQQSISRKQRFGIAASAAWAVLTLCDSAWLSERLDEDEIQFILDDGGANIQRESQGNTCVSHRFYLPTAKPIPAAAQFQDIQIRNKTLFALGILLIELCLSRPFAELRRESQIYSQNVSGAGMQQVAVASTALDDYAVAEMQTDKVYREAGYMYGYAVQRCLRCEFPGRDITKNFQFQQFRTNFFSGVVAPIQATYALIPASCAAF